MRTLTLKFGLLILAIIFSQLTYASDYYFSTSIGNDTRTAAQAQNPATPWKSLNKLNAIFSTLKPGDAVYFKRGDIFFGNIHMNASGSAGNPIRLAAYGGGNDPIITSLQKISSWSNRGNGVIESNGNINTGNAKIVLIDGKIYGMGRFPNDDAQNLGHLEINSVSGGNRITSSQLTSPSSWTGGDVVIKKNQWIIDTHKITNHSGNSLTFADITSYPAREKYGFFIQNHLSTLDKFGEWYYNSNTKRLSIFFGNQSSSNRNIEVSTLDHLLTKTYGTSYVTVQNLHFKGANSDVIYIAGGRDISFDKIKIEYAGVNGILAKSVINIKVENSYVDYSLNNGIFLRYGNTNASIRNNIVKNTAPFAGGVQNGDMAGIGILAIDNNSIVEGNEVYNTGYSGIYFSGNNTIVKNNLVDNFCLIKGDGGGIYTYVGPKNQTHQNRKVIGNIIINGKGSLAGLPNSISNLRGMADGIFLDDNSNGIEISNNTIAHTENTGIKLANARNVIVKDNLIYDTDHNVMIGNSNLGADVSNISIYNNVLFSKTNLQNSYAIHSHKNDIGSMGVFDNNIFFRPFGDSYSFFTRKTVNGSIVETRNNLKNFTTTYNKDAKSIYNEISFTKFKNLEKKGANMFRNGQFDANLTTIDFYRLQSKIVPNKISGRTLEVTSGNNSVLFSNVGALKKGKKYLVKFKSLASQNASIRFHFRYSGSPWEIVSNVVTFDLNSSISENQAILTPLIDVPNAGIIVSFINPNITYWLDDIEIVEVEIEEVKPEEKILFEFNASKQAKKIFLQGKYVDARLKEYSGELTLAPYTGVALFRTTEVETPSLEQKAEDPNIILSLSKSTNNLTIKDTVSITVEIPNNESAKMTLATFYCGLKEIGKCSGYPFQVEWKNLPYGEQYVWASLTDGNGRTFNSEEIDLYIAQAKVIEQVQDKPNGYGFDFQGLNFTPNGIYINTGSTRDAIFNSVKFSSEFVNKNYSGGNIESYTAASNEYLLQNQRFAKELTYDIPVTNGKYNVITFHNEVYFGKRVSATGPNRRVYNIYLEGNLLKKNFDLFVANNNEPTSLVFKEVEVKDGRLTLRLQSVIGDAAISGIAIIPINKENGENQQVVIPSETVNPRNPIHINTGSTRSGEYKGILFDSEHSKNYISNGNMESHAAASVNTMMQSQRFAKELIYRIPVQNGKYNIITYHNEVFFGKKVSTTGPNRRVYSIEIQDRQVKRNFDLFVENNNNEMALEHKDIEVTNGLVKIKLTSVIGDAAISGISIIPVENVTLDIPAVQVNLLPENGIYLNTGSTRDADFHGTKFISEFRQRQYSGGNIESHAPASNQEMFQSQRFAKNLLYTIPIPNGQYTVITYHNEVFFGQKTTNTGPGRRVFDILIEGKVVKKNLDLYVENKNKQMELVFSNIEVKDGNMSINLVSSIADASISGIAIFPSNEKFSAGMANLRQYSNGANNISYDMHQVNPLNENKPKLYPNPAINEVNLVLDIEYSNTRILIHNTAGQLVRFMNPGELNITNKTLTIPLSNLKTGVYIISVSSDRGLVFKEKLLVSK